MHISSSDMRICAHMRARQSKSTRLWLRACPLGDRPHPRLGSAHFPCAPGIAHGFPCAVASETQAHTERPYRRPKGSLPSILLSKQLEKRTVTGKERMLKKTKMNMGGSPPTLLPIEYCMPPPTPETGKDVLAVRHKRLWILDCFSSLNHWVGGIDHKGGESAGGGQRRERRREGRGAAQVGPNTPLKSGSVCENEQLDISSSYRFKFKHTGTFKSQGRHLWGGPHSPSPTFTREPPLPQATA